jgi:hypothetical protein
MEVTAVTKVREDPMEKRLRWMIENLNGAYMARHPEGHPNAGRPCTNSGTCIIVCCYINGLGKVLLKGGPPKNSPRRDFRRFQAFLRSCMNDFLIESDTMGLPSTPKNKSGGDEWLYEVFRCGFIHGYPANVAWGRKPGLNKYWFKYKNRLTLNIDELVRGFRRGIDEFRKRAAIDAELHSRFIEYISKND